jgi:hypothetical protein
MVLMGRQIAAQEPGEIIVLQAALAPNVTLL